MSDATYSAVEDALRRHIADENENRLLTDWVVLAACVDADPLSTFYVNVCSETSPHAIEGLLSFGMVAGDPDELHCD